MSRAADPSERPTFFKLLQLVSLAGRPFARLHGAEHKLSLTEWRVVLGLASRPGMSATEVGEMLGLDKMAISRAVRALERHERLDRRIDPRDARRIALHLTESGWSLHDEITPAARGREIEMFRPLSAAERMMFDALLDRLVAHAGAHRAD